MVGLAKPRPTLPIRSSRGGVNRTLNRSFWRRVLYQLSYWPTFYRSGRLPAPTKLLGLAVRRVLSAARAELAEFQTIRIVTTILLGRVISFLAVITLKGNDRANIFFL